MPRTLRRPVVRGGLAGLLALVVAACATTPAAPPPAQLAGTYSGTVSLGGQQTIFGSLQITQAGSDLGLRFSFAEIGVEAEGTGTATPDGFEGEVEYVLQCPGVAVFDGRLDEEGRVLAGSLTATDCDSAMQGTFRFTRRD